MTAASGSSTVTQRTVGWDEQLDFAARSGDWNPFHVDPVAARRTAFGRPVVHGMHLVELALAAISDVEHGAIGRVQGTFRHPVPVGGEVEITVRREPASGRWRACVDHDVWRALDLVVELREGPHAAVTTTPAVPERAHPSIVDIAGVEGMTGQIDVADGTPGALLRALSRLVGMEVPGLYSVFSSFDITFHDIDGTHDDNQLTYAVSSVDERFGRIAVEVSSRSATGRLTAFFRSPPTDQPSPEHWPVRPEPGEFAGQHALVVGGSRGLGAATAMLLAAGGADVTLTWRVGRDDADEIGAIIKAAGGRASVLELDVTDQASIGHLRAALGPSMPTQLWFFATPPIFDGVNGVYSEALAARFRAVYLTGFARLLDSMDHTRLRTVVNPSSLAVQDHPRLDARIRRRQAGGRTGGGRTRPTASLDPLLHSTPAPSGHRSDGQRHAHRGGRHHPRAAGPDPLRHHERVTAMSTRPTRTLHRCS